MTRSSRTARIGINAVERIVVESLGWIFREQAVDDYGIDAHIEVVRAGKATGRLIAAQVKAGVSHFRQKSAHGFVYSGRLRHLEYWTNHSLPVILILYNPQLKGAWWVPVESDRVSVARDRWTIAVPFSSRFDSLAAASLLSLAIPDFRKRREVFGVINTHAAAIGTGRLIGAFQTAERVLELAYPYVDAELFWVARTISHRVPVRIVTSHFKSEGIALDLEHVLKESPNLDVRIHPPSDRKQFHAKFAIIDRTIAIYGSANLTSRAWHNSAEVVLASDDARVVHDLSHQFDWLWMNAIRASDISEPLRTSGQAESA